MYEQMKGRGRQQPNPLARLGISTSHEAYICIQLPVYVNHNTGSDTLQE